MTRDHIIAAQHFEGELYIKASDHHRAVRSAVAAEREAIAQMIEDAPPLVEFSQNGKGGCMVCGFTPKLASAAIRARGQE